MKGKIMLVLCVLLGLMMINSGLNKIFEYMPPPEFPEEVGNLFNAFMASGWVMPLIAVAEIVGGVLLIPNKTRALGAIVLLPVVLGIFCFHLVQDPSTIAVAIVILAINVWVIVDNKHKYMPMLQA
jgi:putative oxidoreductase